MKILDLKIPEIGDTIDNAWAVQLSDRYELVEVSWRIRQYPTRFKEWKFDGASMLPDTFVAWFLHLDKSKFKQVALQHDLRYAYGTKGCGLEREKADKQFEQDLLSIGMHWIPAKLMYVAVRLFGGERWRWSFSWGFARI